MFAIFHNLSVNFVLEIMSRWNIFENYYILYFVNCITSKQNLYSHTVMCDFCWKAIYRQNERYFDQKKIHVENYIYSYDNNLSNVIHAFNLLTDCISI